MGQDPTERPRSGRRIGRAGVEAMLGLRIQEKCPLFQGTMKKSLVVERCCSWLGEKEASPSCSSLWCPWCMNEWSCSGRDKAGSDGFRFAEVQFLLLVKMFMLMQVSNWSNRGPFLLRRVRCKTALAGSHNFFLGASFYTWSEEEKKDIWPDPWARPSFWLVLIEVPVAMDEDQAVRGSRVPCYALWARSMQLKSIEATLYLYGW